MKELKNKIMAHIESVKQQSLSTTEVNNLFFSEEYVRERAIENFFINGKNICTNREKELFNKLKDFLSENYKIKVCGACGNSYGNRTFWVSTIYQECNKETEIIYEDKEEFSNGYNLASFILSKVSHFLKKDLLGWLDEYVELAINPQNGQETILTTTINELEEINETCRINEDLSSNLFWYFKNKDILKGKIIEDYSDEEYEELKEQALNNFSDFVDCKDFIINHYGNDFYYTIVETKIQDY